MITCHIGFRLAFSDPALVTLEELKSNAALRKKCKAVNKALAYIEHNPNHPGLNTHKYKTSSHKAIFESYAENNTPGAYRIFWHYGPENNTITIVSITPHP